MQMIAHNNFNLGDGLCSISHNRLLRQLQTEEQRNLPESLTHMMGSAMSVEQRIDDFIEAGLRPLGLSFGPVALQHWRRKVFDYMIVVHAWIMPTPGMSKSAFGKARKRRKKNDGN